jgi:peptide deformylase
MLTIVIPNFNRFDQIFSLIKIYNEYQFIQKIIIVDDNGTPIIMINPEITEFSEETVLMNEGCLSVPGVFDDVLRPSWVRVKYRDTKGRYQHLKYDGLTARIIQHEVDHLFGKLFITD